MLNNEMGNGRALGLKLWVGWLIFATVVGGTVSVALSLYYAQRAHHEAHFEQVAGEQVVVLQRGVHIQFRPVRHLATAFSLQEGAVDRRGFMFLAESISLETSPAFLALQWLAPDRDAGGQERFGVHHSYSPVKEQAIDPASTVDQPPTHLLKKASERRELVLGPWQLSDGQVRFWALRAVVRGGNEPALLGFVAGLYQVDRLLTEAYCSVAGGEATEIFVSDPRSTVAGAFGCSKDNARAVRTEGRPGPTGHQLSRLIPIDSTTWEATVTAAHGTFEASGWVAVTISLGGLVLGATLAMFYRVLIAREARVRQLVAQRTEQLQAVNRELEQFVYVASHDLKAPLRAISQISSWIDEDVAEQLDEENRRRLRLMRERVIRMDRLIDGLLTYSRAGRISGEVDAPVPLKPLIEEVGSELLLPAGFRIEIAPSLPSLRADALHLKQVFQNLITNAAAHHDHPDSGHISIRAEDEGRYWRIEVADDGPGIPPQEREGIFELFTSLPSPAGQQHTGIGLTVVRKLVLNYGGRIDVIDNRSRGARFRIWWPK